MTDYNKSTGNAGTLRIRTTGGRIELWVLCSDGSTNVGSITFQTTINGSAQAVTVSLPAGFGSKLIRSATQASGTQTVVLNMPASGTSGLGGPTNHSQVLTLGAVPTAPGPLVVSAITDDSAFFTWGAAGNAPTTYGVYVARDASFTDYVFQAWVGNVLSRPMNDLFVADTVYYARNRAANAIGTGPYNATVSFRTSGAGGVWVDVGGVWKKCPVVVSDGVAWKPALVKVSDGTAWKSVG
jgi:hypothetical protein